MRRLRLVPHRFALAAGLVAVAALLAVLALAPSGRQFVAPVEVTALPALATPAPSIKAAAAVAVVAPATSASSGAGPFVEVCGVGPVAVASAANPEPPRGDAMPGALRAALGDLASSAEPSARAVGLYYEAVTAASHSRGAAYAGNAGCRDDDNCIDNVDAMAAQAAQPYRQQLIATAAQSSDPAAVALAIGLCQEQTPGRPCDDRVNGARWASLEPDNAAAWLQVVTEAKARGDAPAVSEALARASAASRFDDYGRLLLSPVDTAAVKSAAAVDRYQAQSSAAAVWASWPDSAHSQLGRSCLSGALDERERSACSAVAQLMTEESMAGRSIGIAIGERAGWPAERVQALRAEQSRLARIGAAGAPADQAAGLTCAGLDSMQRTLTLRARGTELRELRQRLTAAR